jgi:hypothetical protein
MVVVVMALLLRWWWWALRPADNATLTGQRLGAQGVRQQKGKEKRKRRTG